MIEWEILNQFGSKWLKGEQIEVKDKLEDIVQITLEKNILKTPWDDIDVMQKVVTIHCLS